MSLQILATRDWMNFLSDFEIWGYHLPQVVLPQKIADVHSFLKLFRKQTIEEMGVRRSPMFLLQSMHAQTCPCFYDLFPLRMNHV
jgi:hypothetical protein